VKDYLKRQVLEVNMSHHVRFHHGQTVVDLNGDLTVFLMAAVRHLGFVGRVLGPLTVTKFGRNR